jgi:chitinase
VVGITPNAKTVSVGDTIPFTASVSGAEDQAVVWSIEEGSSGGAITADGLYTAPVLPGTFHVVAIRSADTTHTATATITVQAGDVTGVIQ